MTSLKPFTPDEVIQIAVTQAVFRLTSAGLTIDPIEKLLKLIHQTHGTPLTKIELDLFNLKSRLSMAKEAGTPPNLDILSSIDYREVCDKEEAQRLSLSLRELADSLADENDKQAVTDAAELVVPFTEP